MVACRHSDRHAWVCVCVSVCVIQMCLNASGVHLFFSDPNLYSPMQKKIKSMWKNVNWIQNAIRTVNQVTERAICQRARLTTGFVMEINLIWIHSDSLLPSAQWSEEWCLAASP